MIAPSVRISRYAERDIEAYVDALLERRSYQRAIAEEGITPERAEALRLATSRLQGARARLTGTQLGIAERRARGRNG
jgi:hypothetical protein